MKKNFNNKKHTILLAEIFRGANADAVTLLQEGNARLATGLHGVLVHVGVCVVLICG